MVEENEFRQFEEEVVLKKELLFKIVRDIHGNLTANLAGIDIDIGWMNNRFEFWEMLIQGTEFFEHSLLPEKYVSRYDEVRSIMIETLKGMKKRRDK